MDLRLQSNVDEDQDGPENKQLYEVLEKFVTVDGVSVLNTAKDVSAIAAPEGRKHMKTYVFLMDVFWEVMIPLAYQIPYNHPSQDRIVQLISELSLNSPKSNAEEDPQTSHRGWYKLVGLEEFLQDLWIIPNESTERPPNMSQWVNLHSFSARLFGLRHSDKLWEISYRFPIWAMLYGLEQLRGDSVRMHEMNTLSAAQWAVHSAARLLAFIKQPPVDVTSYPSALFRGDKTYSLDRWHFWRQQFLNASDRDEFSEEVKSVAKSAVHAMDEAEK